MATEFDDIEDLAGWRAKLDELLEAARAAAAKDDLLARLKVSDRLTKFIVKNPPAVPGDPATREFSEMDRIAREASDGLLLATIQERVAAIVSRTSELAALRKTIDNQVGLNAASADSIRLTKVKKVIDATTQAVSALRELKKDLEQAVETAGDAVAGEDNATFTDLAKKIEGLIARIQSVRNQVETSL